MTLQEFEKDLTEKLAAMSDEELITSLRKCGFKFTDEDELSQQDYKTSLKNNS